MAATWLIVGTSIPSWVTLRVPVQSGPALHRTPAPVRLQQTGVRHAHESVKTPKLDARVVEAARDALDLDRMQEGQHDGDPALGSIIDEAFTGLDVPNPTTVSFTGGVVSTKGHAPQSEAGVSQTSAIRGAVEDQHRSDPKYWWGELQSALRVEVEELVQTTEELLAQVHKARDQARAERGIGPAAKPSIPTSFAPRSPCPAPSSR